MEAKSGERNNLLALHVLLLNDDFGASENILKGYCCGLAVLNSYGLRLLIDISFGRFLCHGVLAGEKIGNVDFTVLVGLYCLIEIVTRYGKLNIGDNAVLGSLNDIKTAPVDLVVELHFSSLAVFHFDCLRSLFFVLIGRSLGYSIGTGQKVAENKLTVFVCLNRLVEIRTRYSKPDIRNYIVLGSLNDFKVSPVELVIKAYSCGLAVLYCYGLGRLLHILIRRSFCYGIGAGNKSGKDEFTLVICFGSLVEVGTGYGKLNTRNIAVLGGLNDFKMAAACLQLKDRRHRVGSCKTCNDILFGGIAKGYQHRVARHSRHILIDSECFFLGNR